MTQQQTRGAQRGFQQRQQRAQLARAPMPDDVITGSFGDAARVSMLLRQAAERFNLVSPATTCGSLPDGVEISFSAIMIDPAVETYKITETQLGLGRVALDRIAQAAGIVWDQERSGRLDDRSHPHYCVYRAAAWVRDLDFTLRPLLPQEKVMDLRDGAPREQDLIAQSASKLRRERSYNKNNLTDAEIERAAREAAKNQLRAERLHIEGHCQTKARNKVVRALGVRHSYSPEELAKPFVIVRPTYSGRSDDPQIRRENAAAIREAALGSARALFGAPAQTAAPAALPAEVHTFRSPPPISDYVDSHVVTDEPPMNAAPRQERRAPAREPQESRAAGGAGGGAALPFGRAKGTPVRDADESDLEWVANALAEMIDNPEKARFRDDNQALLDAIDAELRRRRGEDEEPPSDENIDPETGEVY